MEKQTIDTPLGPMIAVSKGLFLIALSFEDSFDAPCGDSNALRSIANELSLYFKGELAEFKTPLSLETGTIFQQKVWRELANIPFGATRSYAQIATAIGQPKAVRAGAQANGANPLAIVIPCHRVIQTDGSVGGYSGKIERKQWLLDWERKTVQSRG